MRVATTILVVDDDDVLRAWSTAILSDAGWTVVSVDGGAAAVAAVAGRPDLAVVLMDIQMPDCDGYAATAAIRAGGGLGADVPILAFTASRVVDPDAHYRAAGMDGHVAKGCRAEHLRAAVGRWRPLAPHPAERLGLLLGTAQVAGLMDRFRVQLADGLAMLDDPDDRATRAHRLAGLAGTLGFPDVSAAWLAISEGDDSAMAAARIASRRSLRLLDRGLLVPAAG